MNVMKKLSLAILFIPCVSFSMEKGKTWDSETYDENSSSHYASAMELLSRIFSIAEDAKVLHLACDTGNISAKLVEMVPDGLVVGLDQSKDKIGLAKSNYRKLVDHQTPRLFFGHRRAQDLESVGRFDIVVFTAALHYIKPEEQLDVLKKVHRALRPGGKLLLRSPERVVKAPHQAAAIETVLKEEWTVKLAGADTPEAREAFMKKLEDAVGGARTKDELQELLDKSGFESEVSIYNHIHKFESQEALEEYFAEADFRYEGYRKMSPENQKAFTKETTELYMEKADIPKDNVIYRIPLLTAIATKPE